MVTKHGIEDQLTGVTMGAKGKLFGRNRKNPKILELLRMGGQIDRGEMLSRLKHAW